MVTAFKPILDAYTSWLNFQVEGVDLPTQRWAYAVINDCIHNLLRGDNYIKGIALIEINNNVGKLPAGFHEVEQAAYATFKVPPTRTQITEYIQYNLGDDCKFVVSLECNKCGKTECTCDDLLYRIDLSEMDYPEIRLRNYPHFHDFHSPDPLHPLGNCRYAPGFCLMRPSQGAFHNSSFHIKNCVNFNVDSEISYTILPPEIEVNFKKGWVILAYKGFAMQGGFYMVPDNPKVYAAIRSCLDYWWDYARLRGGVTNEGKAMLEISKRAYDEAEYAAIGELSTIASDRWDAITDQLNQIIPMNGFENMYRRGGDFGDFEGHL